MKVSRTLWIVVIGLTSLHIVVLLAEFFSPYDFARQDREVFFAPPSRIHWVHTNSHFGWHPIVYRLTMKGGEFQSYEEDTRIPYPIHLLAHGSTYSVMKTWTLDRHFFGVDPPAQISLMGTDAYGRDLFSRVLYGGRISLFAGAFAALLSVTLGVGLGAIAGFYGSWVDSLIMRCVDLFIALPWLYLLLAFRASLPLHVSSLKVFFVLIMVIGVVGWARPARLIRGIVLSVKERSHVLAARSFGASNLYLLRRHILPETQEIILTQMALLIPQYVLAEVTLSFLGLGVSEPIPSWGNMLVPLQHFNVMVTKWWMFFPGLVLIPVFMGYTLIANELQRTAGRAAK
jgi:peptide/nickel transport system permease protein